MYFTFCEIKTELDVDRAYRIYRSNEEYFQLVSGKAPSRPDVLNDRDACPPDVPLGQKKYGMYLLAAYKGGRADSRMGAEHRSHGDNDNSSYEPIAVVDVLEGFPDEKTYYIGLFLIDGTCHRRGLGKALYKQMESEAKLRGFERIRLGVVDTNHGARAFWKAMGFVWVKTVDSTLHEGSGWTVEIMEKNL